MAESTSAPTKKTPLYEVHVRATGKIIEFGGWLLPVQYTSILEEHRAVRQSAGMFDVSHLGKVEVRGGDALAFLQRLTTNDLSRLEVGGAQYGLMCRDNGGIIDDVFVYRLLDRYLVVVNAATTDKDVAWLREHARGDIEVENVTPTTATISVQGPDAVRLVQPLAETDLTAMKRHTIAEAAVAGHRMLVARTGYTGESGVELFPTADAAEAVWNAIVERSANVRPCGLGARDTLRLEVGNRLYGHDMDETTNPIEAGLDWAVKLDKGDFIGRDQIARVQASGPQRRLVGFETVERAVAREGCDVFRPDGIEAIGVVTSGSFSPSLNKNIGFAYVRSDQAEPGTELAISVRGRPIGARVVETPFYRRPRSRRGA